LIVATVTSGWGTAPAIHDNPLVANQTNVQARHVTELRDAINALRSHLGLTAYSWLTSATTNDLISASPIQEMRTALDQALGAPSGGYSSGLAQGQPVKAIHIQELRDRVLSVWISTTSLDLRWLVSDELGTPRVIIDQSGSLSTVSRHDYLPFGEELGSATGARTPAQGYSTSDVVRQHFTSKERDVETGLDYFLARYYSSNQGRFVSVDPENAGATPNSPQSWNGYAYAFNNPIKYQDPDGLTVRICGTDGKCTDDKTDLSDDDFAKYFTHNKSIRLTDGNIYQNGELIGRFERGPCDECLYGTALLEIGRRTAPIPKAVLAFEGVSIAGGLLATVVIPAGSGLTVLGLEAAAPEVTAAGTQVISQATMRAFQRQLAQYGRRALERSLRSFEKRLAEHLLKIEAARRAGGYTSSMETEVKIFRESIAAIKQILGNGP